MQTRMLLFDLDGTLLRSDKAISPRTLEAIRLCRRKGILIGVATSRGEQNASVFFRELAPDDVISSAGALVRCRDKVTHQNGFSAEETAAVIGTLRQVLGPDVPMTVDTANDYYRNYIVPEDDPDQTWNMGNYTDFNGFALPSLKICFESHAPGCETSVRAALPHCDLIHFSDGPWYKLTPSGATKENAILQLCGDLGLTPGHIAAFGDDFADIGMLKLCGRGIAMGNAIPEVKRIADEVIGDNDHDGIGEWIEKELLG